MSQRVEDVLRKIPLYNSQDVRLPQERPPLRLAKLDIPPVTTTRQNFEAWIHECEQLEQDIDARTEKSSEFDQWYAAKYLNKQPPGIGETTILSPTRKNTNKT